MFLCFKDLILSSAGMQGGMRVKSLESGTFSESWKQVEELQKKRAVVTFLPGKGSEG